MDYINESERLGTHTLGDEPDPLINQGRTIPEVCETVGLATQRLLALSWSGDIGDPDDARRLIRLAHALSDELYAIAAQLETWHDRALNEGAQHDRDTLGPPGGERYGEPPAMPPRRAPVYAGTLRGEPVPKRPPESLLIAATCREPPRLTDEDLAAMESVNTAR